MQPTSDGRDLQLSLDAWGRLVLTTPAGRLIGVEPMRAFPISDPGHWISICDAEGREVLCLESMDGLKAETRQLLLDELSQREFIPAIQRIVRVLGEGLPVDWEVLTDRGPTRFTVDNEDDVRGAGPNRVLITDARKLRYLIPDTRTLDGQSRRLLERFL